MVSNQTLSRNEKQSWNIEENPLLGKRVTNGNKLDVKDMLLADWLNNYVEKVHKLPVVTSLNSIHKKPDKLNET